MLGKRRFGSTWGRVKGSRPQGRSARAASGQISPCLSFLLLSAHVRLAEIKFGYLRLPSFTELNFSLFLAGLSQSGPYTRRTDAVHLCCSHYLHCQKFSKLLFNSRIPKPASLLSCSGSTRTRSRPSLNLCSSRRQN